MRCTVSTADSLCSGVIGEAHAHGQDTAFDGRHHAGPGSIRYLGVNGVGSNAFGGHDLKVA